MRDNEWIGAELRPLLEFNRGQVEGLQAMGRRPLQMLERHPRLEARIRSLESIDGVGPVTALTWALEVGTPHRFGSIKQAVSYCRARYGSCRSSLAGGDRCSHGAVPYSCALG